MDYLSEFLAVDSKVALQFFFAGLGEVETPVSSTREERLYTASILAHFSQVSIDGSGELPLLSDPSALFDHFIFDPFLLELGDVKMFEMAGGQVLFYFGFLSDQVRRRHSQQFF